MKLKAHLTDGEGTGVRVPAKPAHPLGSASTSSRTAAADF